METPFIITVITDLANITSLVNSHTRDEKKTQQWLNSTHPLLGVEPISKVFEGKTEELRQIINNEFEGCSL